GLINRNSDQKYFDGYVPEDKVMVPQKDSIIHLSIGQTFGPYYDNNEIVYAKLIDRKQMPDSVKFGHILISTQPQRQGQVPLSDSAAKKRADSILTALRGGADFKALALQFSDDPGSRQNGGEYDITPMQTFPEQLKELNDYVLSNPVGAMKVIKTPVGYSVVKIMDVKNIGPAIKVAYLSKTVEASQETNSTAFGLASTFAANNRTQAAFNKSAQEKGTKRVADNIRPMDFVVNGLGSCRDLVKWAYDAKVGDVSNVFTLEDKYVVAVLTEAREAGTAKLSAVRPIVEAEVKRRKKADQIIGKLGNVASVDAAATATNQPVMQAEGINFSTPFIASLGFEPKIAGAAFNKAWGTAKASAPIAGNAGVYVIKVNAYVPAQNGQDINNVKASYEQGLQSTLSNSLFEVLKDKANVKDTRSKFM
ncbi:MAG TPA: peptidylprolyl isomerase, partial [Chitinophaga sp.]